jgi:hypothetical protein
MRFAQDIWENPRGNRLGRGVWNNCEAIIAACCGALERLYGQIRAHGLNWNQRLGEGQEVKAVDFAVVQAVVVSAKALERRRRRTFRPTGDTVKAKFSRTPSAPPTRSTLKLL